MCVYIIGKNVCSPRSQGTAVTEWLNHNVCFFTRAGFNNIVL